MLPFTSTGLLWWESLLYAAALAIVAAIAYANLQELRRKRARGALSMVKMLVLGAVLFASVIASFLFAINGLILFSNLG